MDELRPLKEYPEISFIENYTMEKLEKDMINWYKKKRKELTGEDVILAPADDRRIILQTGAYFIFQGYMCADETGKMGLLKYAKGDFLENLGALVHVYRKPATGSTTTIRFSLKEPRTVATGVKQGIRLTAGDGVYFSIDDYYEISIGKTSVDAKATCMSAGSAGNQYEAGDISIMVDKIPFIDRAENITKPENGSDIEDDESLRERIYTAFTGNSSAGTVSSYKHLIKEFDAGISDVSITSPEPCIVRIRYLLKGGGVPGQESINKLKEYLSQPDIKILTDKIEVLPPELVKYDLNVTYYINQSDRNRVDAIKINVEEAINRYITWQGTKMGRDINPDELIREIKEAGAKRAVILSPEFSVVGIDAVASINTETIKYGGLEDD